MNTKLRYAVLVLLLIGLAVYIVLKFELMPKQVDPQEAAKILNSPSSPLEEKIELVKDLKTTSLDEKVDPQTRVEAAKVVTSTFFDHGTALSKGFSENGFSEREVYEYAKEMSAVADSDRLPLLAAYIGLRFYSNEMDKESVADYLHTYQRVLATKGTDNLCGNSSKFASVIYLSQKNQHTDVSEDFGNYFKNFQIAFSKCPAYRKTAVAFMWLAAISDIGSTTAEEAKGQELLTLITADTSKDSPLAQNLSKSYFSPNPEPDTQSIVDRFVQKYPEFKLFLEKIKPN
jgi:hypothetical protein